MPLDLPRGYRNNNPLNIEAGSFASGQPGFTGSDGRFAQFETMDHGIGAADALLSGYGRRGINTVSGVINRWAPPSDNNPSDTYAASVAKGMGIDPGATIDLSDPAVRQGLITHMAQFENGQPLPGTTAAAPAAIPAAASAAAPAAVTPGLFAKLGATPDTAEPDMSGLLANLAMPTPPKAGLLQAPGFLPIRRLRRA